MGFDIIFVDVGTQNSSYRPLYVQRRSLYVQEDGPLYVQGRSLYVQEGGSSARPVGTWTYRETSARSDPLPWTYRGPSARSGLLTWTYRGPSARSGLLSWTGLLTPKFESKIHKLVPKLRYY